ncbi:unnamed protein product [Aphanomyces euteiches]
MKHAGIEALHPDEVNRFRAKAFEAVQTLSAFGSGNTSLEHYHSEGDCQVYHRKAAGAPFGELTSTVAVHVSFDDAHYALYNRHSKDHRTFLALHHGEDYLEGTVLNTTLTRSPDDLFQWFGVKYMKVYMPGTTMFEPRDATYFEYSMSTTDARGRRIAIFIRETHAFPTVPPYPEVSRIRFTSAQLVTEVGLERVEVVHRLCLQDVGKIPGFVVKKLILQILLLGATLPSLLQKRRLLDSTPLDGSPAPPMYTTTTKDPKCVTCNAKFGAFRSAFHCAACGHAMCKSCRVLVFRALHKKSVSPVVKLCFCKKCSIEARVTRSNSVSSAASVRSRSTGSVAQSRSGADELKSRSSSSDSASTISVGMPSTLSAMNGVAEMTAPPCVNEILYQMQTSLEDQKMLLQMMQMRLAEQERQRFQQLN